MALRNAAQCEHLAKQIRAKLGFSVAEACRDSIVSPQRLAGLISVENAQLNPLATRFEPAVFEKLRRVRDSWLPRTYNGIHRSAIRDASDAALRALATSYGYTQIMGWHVLTAPLAQHSVSELRDPARHLGFAVQLLEYDAGKYFRAGNYPAALHVWNTGSAMRPTHDPDYVANATGVAAAYRLLT